MTGFGHWTWLTTSKYIPHVSGYSTYTTYRRDRTVLLYELGVRVVREFPVRTTVLLPETKAS